MSDRGITIQDIANELGLSKSTVSKALSQATDVNEQTREKVLSMASEMGYELKGRNEGFGQNLLMLTYSMSLDDMEQFAYEVMLGFQSEANKHGFGITLISVNEHEMKTGLYTNKIDLKMYRGCFFAGFRPHDSFAAEMERTKTPVVILDNDYDSVFAARIGCDHSLGIKQAVAHLVSLGHKQIGFLGGERESNVTEERELAYKETLLRSGIKPDIRLCAYSSFTHKFGNEMVLELVRQGATAIVCASDIIAIRAMKQLAEAGIAVPDKVSVTGYDDLPAAKYCVPTLTSVSQNRVQIGKSAFGLIEQMRAGNEISRILLRPRLIVRESTKKPV